MAYDSNHRQKLAHREVYMAEPTMPSFLQWSESAITFDRTDHPESVPQPRRYPLLVNPIIGMKWLTKVLMDGGSSLHIMYAKMLDAMDIDRSRIRPSSRLEDTLPRLPPLSGTTDGQNGGSTAHASHQVLCPY